MGKTDRWPNLKVNGSLVLQEMRELNFNGENFNVSVDGSNESASFNVNSSSSELDPIPLIIALG